MKNGSFATNKRATFDYTLLTQFTAGLVLSGDEAKSIRGGGASLKGSFVTLDRNDEAWLTNAHINAYSHGSNDASYDPTRGRKLLLKESELKQLRAARDQKLVLVAHRIFPAGKYIKLGLAIAKPKKLYDKRSTIQKRDLERQEQRNFKA